MSHKSTDKRKTHTYSTSDDMRQLDVPIFAKLYGFYTCFSQNLLSFPKTKRYTLGQKIDALSLDVFELLFSVPHRTDKLSILLTISAKLDLLKVLIRLAKDTDSITNKQYITLQSLLQEIGKMLGGWIKASKK